RDFGWHPPGAVAPEDKTVALCGIALEEPPGGLDERIRVAGVERAEGILAADRSRIADDVARGAPRAVVQHAVYDFGSAADLEDLLAAHPPEDLEVVVRSDVRQDAPLRGSHLMPALPRRRSRARFGRPGSARGRPELSRRPRSAGAGLKA